MTRPDESKREVIRALVDRRLLVWARESSGLSIPDASRRIGVEDHVIHAWEHGTAHPTITQLRQAAHVYLRPLGAFYLPEPPKEARKVRDFRRVQGARPRQSYELLREVRRAFSKRETAIELLAESGESMPKVDLTASVSDDPEQVGARIRTYFGMTRDLQLRLPHTYGALNWWRSALEASGILVFQAFDVGTDEMRGFSIAEWPLPVVVVNNADAAVARVFSAVHELAHLMLQEAGLCTMEESGRFSGHARRIEGFCNHVAGATLVPQDALQLEELVLSSIDDDSWNEDRIRLLANRYRVSRETMLRRLLLMGRITEAFYQRKRDEYQQEYRALRELPKTGFLPPATRAVAASGPAFVRLVISSYASGRITAADLSGILDLRMKHLPRLSQLTSVSGRPTGNRE